MAGKIVSVHIDSKVNGGHKSCFVVHLSVL